MAQRLFLLDGMALFYRAHFAFAQRPIRTSSGFNTSALFGFTNTLLDILATWNPSHLAVALDTEAPTPRHTAFPEYKAQREAMPEELSAALPHLRRLLAAFRIPSLELDGYEADDLIGTLVKRAEAAGFESYMATPDKDFGQLVTERTVLWKPGRQGGEVELMKPADVCARWGIARVGQVIDMLGLMGDASDNIPGVPGVGEKTAAKLLSQYDTLENVLAHASEVKGKLGESLRTHAEMALLSKQLATIVVDAPLETSIEQLALQSRDEDALQAFCVEFEFNTLGRRLFGEGFKAGRGAARIPGVATAPGGESVEGPKRGTRAAPAINQAELFVASPAESAVTLHGPSVVPGLPHRAEARTDAGPSGPPSPLMVRTQDSRILETTQDPLAAPRPLLEDSTGSGGSTSPAGSVLLTIAEVPHRYRLVSTAEDRAHLAGLLESQKAFCFDTETDGLDARTGRLVGVSFSFLAGEAWYVSVAGPRDPGRSLVPEELLPFLKVFADPEILKVGHNVKFDLLTLRWQGVPVTGPFFDTMIAHALVEPELRHGMDYLSESLLGYSPIPIERLIGPAGSERRTLAEVPVEQVAEYSAEDADVTWRLHQRLLPLLKERGQERVFYEVEMPVLPALAAMEFEGIRLDAAALSDYGRELAKEMVAAEADVHRLAGREFNVNSNKQLGSVLFEELRLVEKPRKTPTGQYATDEQTLLLLAGDHAIVRRLLDHRTVAKLKSTYTDTLPQAIFTRTGRVHTTFFQAATATGRLSSSDPNVQNIPIRTERGQEIRKAFVAREGWLLLSADYSQIELRIIAALAREEAMIEAFRNGADIHTATAARVFGVAAEGVVPEMRRRAKMVNFGIAYGISAFGLAQRLGIPRGEAAAIIGQYFASYPGIRRYMDDTIAFARHRGHVETMTGRRRILRDINSANATVRAAAERNAINAPIQGTAADMIKIAMARIHQEIERRRLASRLLLQVHDELVFDLQPSEESGVRSLVEESMRTALPLPGDVPIVVEMGTGTTWLEAH